jgi:hypothetical protein
LADFRGEDVVGGLELHLAELGVDLPHDEQKAFAQVVEGLAWTALSTGCQPARARR